MTEKNDAKLKLLLADLCKEVPRISHALTALMQVLQEDEILDSAAMHRFSVFMQQYDEQIDEGAK